MKLEKCKQCSLSIPGKEGFECNIKKTACANPRPLVPRDDKQSLVTDYRHASKKEIRKIRVNQSNQRHLCSIFEERATGNYNVCFVRKPASPALRR